MSSVQTSISDIVTPEILADQLSAKYPDMLVLGNSGLVEVDGTFPLGTPGSRFKMPFWKRIAPFSDMTEGTPLQTGKIQAAAEYCTVQRGGTALEVLDTSELVSKADPVSEITNQLGRRAAEYIDYKLVSQCELTPNVFDQTGANSTQTASNLLDQNAFIRALLTLGDNQGNIRRGGMIIAHSKVVGDLQQVGALQNMYQSGMDILKTGVMQGLLGLPIIESDLVTTTSVSGITNYHTYIIGPGSLALFYQRKVMIEFDRDILLQADVIASTVHFAAHLYGYDDSTSSIVAEQNKSVHVVKLISK